MPERSMAPVSVTLQRRALLSVTASKILQRIARSRAFSQAAAIRFSPDGFLEKALNYLNVAPDTDEPPLPEVEVPDVTGLTVEDAAEVIEGAGFSYVLDGAGAVVRSQLPAAGAMASQGALMMLYVEGSNAEAASARVPDVTGMTVLEANKLIRSFGLEMSVDGSGLAVSQSPEAGECVNPTSVVRVRFEPP